MLFDMDGTLVDSEKVWDIALSELATHAGGELSADARRAMIGGSMATSMQVLHDDLGQPWRDAATDAAWVTERVHELFGDGLVWRPGARELLAVVRSAGLPTALVAIEDSPTGVASARASGAAVLAVPCELDLPLMSGVVLRDSLLGVDLTFLAGLAATVRA